MHVPTVADEEAAFDVLSWCLERMSNRSTTFPPAAKVPLLGISPSGLGTARAWEHLRYDVMPTALPSDHPGYLAFIPGAASVAAILADMAMSAAGIYAGSALEGGEVVAAERAALTWLASLIGLPHTAHGAFVSGGSMANLSALVTARDDARSGTRRDAKTIITSAAAHSSIASAAEIMDCELVSLGDDEGRLTADLLRTEFERRGSSAVVAVAATAGTTNLGIVDELAALARTCEDARVWLHVDAAYGGGALLSERTRPLLAGIESADSVTIDPHKWLFTPFDCGAVLYRHPERALAAHRQLAPYLEAVQCDDNPSDYAVHLTRRARGIPLWMSLVANGTDAYTDAVEHCLDLTSYTAECIRGSEHLELACEPELSIVAFRRTGWTPADYVQWSNYAVASGLGLVTPTRHRGEPAFRMCFVNPLTEKADVDRIIEALGSRVGELADDAVATMPVHEKVELDSIPLG